jgi:Ca2+-transporting ATPase
LNETIEKDWYQISTAEAFERQGSSKVRGLQAADAQRRLEQFGLNELVERGTHSPWQILWEQVTGILTLILIAAAAVSLFLGDTLDAIVILAIVVLNAALGFSQEYKAEQSMAALKRMAVPNVRVRREGQVQSVSARELVPGDVVLLETGNVVPADGRVVESVNLRVQESALTGESEAVDKEAELVIEGEKTLGDRRNMVFMGTIVNYGHGEVMVTATGMQTELGHIADMIQTVGQEKTPLQKRLDQLGRWLAIAALGIVAVIFLFGVLRGEDIEEMLLTSVSLAVAAVPEALTAVVTIALSLGAQRMLKRRALIRKLPAVETLGSVSVICSDKTGTLTLNQMTVTVLDVANHRVDLMQRSGETDFDLLFEDSSQAQEALIPTIDLLLMGGALCNDAILQKKDGEQEGFLAVGDPTEGALVLSAAQFGILKEELDKTFPRVAELPFDSDRKRMTTVHQIPTSADAIPQSLVPFWQRRQTQEVPPYLAFTKGAIDGMLGIANEVWVNGRAEPLDESWRARIKAAHDQLAQNGMRVLGVGLRGLEKPPAKEEMDLLETDLILVGLFGLLDPPRAEVVDAVKTCKTAGIRPVMITGDHPLTARYIATELGLSENERFITGQELDKMTPEQLKQASREVSVFARVSPEHKLKLIQAYQEQNLIVSMTGDGVNDAPALKKADIGVAMGITGTDVAKEASDMILLDDNFATIVAAVEEGRTIFDNIRKFIKYLLSCNMSEISVMLIGPFLGMPLPLLPLQILWMNLITDGLPALALGVEPAEENVMRRPPYSSTESIFGHGAIQFIVGMGVVMSLISIAVGYFSWQAGWESWQTLLFTTLILSQLALALSVRSEENSLFKIGLFSNKSMVWAILGTVLLQLAVIYVPFFQRIFDTQALTWQELLIAVGFATLAWLVVEIQKAVTRNRRSS